MLRGLQNPAMRAALAGFFTLAAVMGVGRFVYTPILPMMIEGGALNAAEAGFVAGANYLGYLAGALGASLAFFAPRRRFWLFAALLLSTVTTVIMATAPALPGMVVVRFLSGVASAYAMIFVTAIVMGWLAAEHRPGLLSVQFAGVGFGIAGSAAIVSALAAAGVDWRDIWAYTGLASLIAVAAIFLVLPRQSIEPAPAPDGSSADTSFPSSLWTYICGYGFFGFGYVITATFINTMAKAEPALRPVEPWIWMIVGIAGIPSVWMWNRYAGRTSLSRAFAVACLVEAAGVALSVSVLTPAALIVSAILLGGTFIPITAMGLARARQMTGSNPARVVALMTAAFGTGQMVGPVVAGWLLERSGSLYSASMLAGASLVAAAMLITLAEKMMRQGH